MRDLFDDNNFIFVGFSQKYQPAIRRMHRTGHEFVSHLITQFKARFPSESIDIIGSLASLFPKRMCKGDGLISFGLEDMDKIITFYGHMLDVTTLIDEYQEYKFWVIDAYAMAETKHFLRLLSADQYFRDNYTTIHQLLIITFTLVAGSVGCERGFSLQNLIKDDLRNSLTTSSLCNLMRCSADGPDMTEFDAVKYGMSWVKKKKRRIAFHTEIRKSSNLQ
jgi:hypothetical protein